jgi:hypothetical protein
MKFAEGLMFIDCAFLLVTHSSNAVQPEVLYSFPSTPTGSSNIAAAFGGLNTNGDHLPDKWDGWQFLRDEVIGTLDSRR